MGNYDEPELTGGTRRKRWPIVLAAALALLVGGAGGYALRALTTEPPAPVVTATPPAPASPTPAPPSPTPCAAAAEAGAALVEQLQLGATAIGNLDPGELREVLDRVQRLQGELELAVRDCSGKVAPSTPPPPPSIPAPNTPGG